MKKYRYFSYVTLTHGLIALISYLALLVCDHVLFFPVTKTIYLLTYLILFSTAMRLSQKNKAYTSGLRAVVTFGSLHIAKRVPGPMGFIWCNGKLGSVQMSCDATALTG